MLKVSNSIFLLSVFTIIKLVTTVCLYTILLMLNDLNKSLHLGSKLSCTICDSVGIFKNVTFPIKQ